MSKERELLKGAVEWLQDLKYMWADTRDSGDWVLLELIADIKRIENLLAQPEQDLREDLREGISLRDHFAGLAMQGVVVSRPTWEDTRRIALTSYEMADAMLAEREKGNDH